MKELVSAVEESYKKLGHGNITVPPRSFVDTKEGGDYLYGAASNLDSERFIVLGSPYMPWNNSTSNKVVTGYYMLINFRTGELEAVLDGTDIVVYRTGAKSAVAVKHLAKKDSTRLGLLGLGTQMKTQAEAIVAVKDIKEIYAFTSNPQNHQDTIEYIKSKTGIEVKVTTKEEVIQSADIIVASTYSKESLLSYSDLHPGQLVISTAHSEEISRDLVFNAKTIVDFHLDLEKEKGPVYWALQDGYDKSKLTELSHVVLNPSLGRENEGEIIYFQSLGVMNENLAAVEYIFDKLS